MIANNLVILALTLIVEFGQFSECQLFQGGECLDVQTVKNFDVQRYMGEWFEYQKYPSDLEKNNKCGMDNYELRDSGDVTILKSQYNTFSKSYVEMVGTASDVGNGRINVQFKDVHASSRSRFWILDTDYTSYSVLYACTPITDHYHSKMVWIMTREKEPKQEVIVKAIHALVKNRLPLSYLSIVDQTGCYRRAGNLDKIMEFLSQNKGVNKAIVQ